MKANLIDLSDHVEYQRNMFLIFQMLWVHCVFIYKTVEPFLYSVRVWIFAELFTCFSAPRFHMFLSRDSGPGAGAGPAEAAWGEQTAARPAPRHRSVSAGFRAKPTRQKMLKNNEWIKNIDLILRLCFSFRKFLPNTRIITDYYYWPERLNKICNIWKV